VFWDGNSGFGPQVVSVPQSFSSSADGVLNALHVSACAGKNVNSPVRIALFIELVFDLDVRDEFAARKGPDFLHGNSFKIVSGDEFFGHRAGSIRMGIETDEAAKRSGVRDKTLHAKTNPTNRTASWP
jgi:hypothetical protein